MKTAAAETGYAVLSHAALPAVHHGVHAVRTTPANRYI